MILVQINGDFNSIKFEIMYLGKELSVKFWLSSKANI
jgi:hypothetical protein